MPPVDAPYPGHSRDHRTASIGPASAWQQPYSDAAVMSTKPACIGCTPAQPEFHAAPCAEMPSPDATPFLDQDDTHRHAADQRCNLIQLVAQIATRAEQQGLPETALLLHETAKAIRSQLAAGRKPDDHHAMPATPSGGGCRDADTI